MTNSSAPLNSGSQPNPSLEEVGHVVANHEIPVELSTRFLEHFSEQLYSSPQKAFEELISNGWDAGATFVDVRLSPDLKASDATLCVLDNGTSMDEEGLRLLWRIAFSPKESTPHQHGRPIIGKFGIGKLATYVLANKLTYICKAEDGVIRRVTMDYGKIDQQREASPDRLISELKLPLYTMSEEELETALNEIDCGAELLNLIRNNVPSPVADSTNDEWGTSESQLTRAASQTWTLVVLSGLKPIGSTMKIGLLRRMLSAALPFGSEMAICINGDLLTSSKSNATVKEEWNIGPKISELGIDAIEIEVDEPDADDGADDNVTSSDDSETQPESKKEKIQITSSDTPYEHIEIPGIGKITGKVKLFEERISGGKSEDRGASNGFHINVLGRVVNQNDPSFGEENLSHAAWARFRMTVRVDGLNPFLTTNREQFREQRELKIFRAFLRQAFNKIRSVHDSDQNAAMPDGGDKLVQSLGVLSLSPLRNVVTEVLGGQPSLAALFDQSNIPDAEEKRKSWRDNTSEHIKNALDEIKYERMDDDSFVKFRISDNTIVVNKDHPFVQEHSRSRAEKELVLTVAMVNLLADVYALDIGVQPAALESIRNYRDQLMRFRAMQRRESGSHIAYLLTQSQNDSSHSKLMELVVSDALRYLGFHVLDLAKPGEPEGIATAFTFPSKPPTADDPTSALYRFSFDAKSSKHDKAQTGKYKPRWRSAASR